MYPPLSECFPYCRYWHWYAMTFLKFLTQLIQSGVLLNVLYKCYRTELEWTKEKVIRVIPEYYHLQETHGEWGFGTLELWHSQLCWWTFSSLRLVNTAISQLVIAVLSWKMMHWMGSETICPWGMIGDGHHGRKSESTVLFWKLFCLWNLTISWVLEVSNTLPALDDCIYLDSIWENFWII